MEFETLSMEPITTHFKAFVGVAWQKATELDQRKMTKNIYEHITNQYEALVEFIVEEVQRRNSPRNPPMNDDSKRINGV